MMGTVMALLVSALVLLGVWPTLLAGVGLWLEVPPAKAHRLVLVLLVPGSATLGLIWLGWAALTRLQVARAASTSTPSSRRLVMGGPYRYARNPVALGAPLYALGFGTLFASLGAGLFAGLVTLVLFAAYHKLIEERLLEARFGDTYRRYRERTPFLIPSVTRYVDRRL